MLPPHLQQTTTITTVKLHVASLARTIGNQVRNRSALSMRRVKHLILVCYRQVIRTTNQQPISSKVLAEVLATSQQSDNWAPQVVTGQTVVAQSTLGATDATVATCSTQNRTRHNSRSSIQLFSMIRSKSRSTWNFSWEKSITCMKMRRRIKSVRMLWSDWSMWQTNGL